MKHYYINTLLIFGLFGCASTRQPQVTHIQPTPVPGTSLTENEVEKVRYQETIKEYPVNPYIDPNNPDIRHDGHSIQRVETTSQWNLTPNTPTSLLRGPTLAVRDANEQTKPLAQDLEIQAKKLNMLLSATTEQNQYLADQVKELKSQIEETRATLTQALTNKFVGNFSGMQPLLKELQDELKNNKTRTEELAQQIKILQIEQNEPQKTNSVSILIETNKTESNTEKPQLSKNSFTDDALKKIKNRLSLID